MSTSQVESFRGGAGEPLVLVHGGTGTWRVWERVLPLLTPHHDVLAPTLPGHLGGSALTAAATIETYTDGVEEAMDAAGWETAHLAGNSLGGWVAMELARRGRARSVVALSPAGGWSLPERRVRRIFAATEQRVRRSRRLLPLVLASRASRRLAFRNVVEHGDRITREEALSMCEAVLRSDYANGLPIFDMQVQSYPDPGVPVLVAWSAADRIFPKPTYQDAWRAAAPHAQVRELPGVGHVPMYDDSRLVADTIFRWAAADLSEPASESG